MKYLYVIIAIVMLASCEKTEDEKAAQLLEQIESLYEKGDYAEALDSITSLRMNHPLAVKARRRAIVLWDLASLKMAQADIALTDSALQATLSQIEHERDLYTANMLRAKRDSLKARYEAMCAVVRRIHKNQKERNDSIE